MIALAVRNTRSRTYPALPGSVLESRRWATQAAARAGAAPEIVEKVRLAVSEAVTNVVLHAYAGAPGEVQVTLAVTEDEFWVLVTDRGRGQQAASPSPGLGWGLALIADACQDFLITEPAGGGTELRMGFSLSATRRMSGQSGPTWPGRVRNRRYERGSSRSASAPLTPRFSTTR